MHFLKRKVNGFLALCYLSCACVCARVCLLLQCSHAVCHVCVRRHVCVCVCMRWHTHISVHACVVIFVCVCARIHPQCSVTVCARASVHVQYVCVRTFVCTARKHPQSSSPHHARRLVTGCGCGCGVSRGSVGNKSSGSSRSGSGSQQQSIQLGAKTDESATQRQREVNKKSP